NLVLWAAAMTSTFSSHGLPCLARSKPTPKTLGAVTPSKAPKRRDTDNVGVGLRIVAGCGLLRRPAWESTLARRGAATAASSAGSSGRDVIMLLEGKATK